MQANCHVLFENILVIQNLYQVKKSLQVKFIFKLKMIFIIYFVKEKDAVRFHIIIWKFIHVNLSSYETHSCYVFGFIWHFKFNVNNAFCNYYARYPINQMTNTNKSLIRRFYLRSRIVKINKNILIFKLHLWQHYIFKLHSPCM